MKQDNIFLRDTQTVSKTLVSYPIYKDGKIVGFFSFTVEKVRISNA
jgi:hypothetical protein